MSNAPQVVTPELLKFWTTASRDFTGCLPPLTIRIEWLCSGGVVRSAMGDFDGGEVQWIGGEEVPAALSVAARDCAYDAGESVVPGCTFEGHETSVEMLEAIDSLAEGRRFIAEMAGPPAVVAGTVEWFRAVGVL